MLVLRACVCLIDYLVLHSLKWTFPPIDVFSRSAHMHCPGSHEAHAGPSSLTSLHTHTDDTLAPWYCSVLSSRSACSSSWSHSTSCSQPTPHPAHLFLISSCPLQISFACLLSFCLSISFSPTISFSLPLPSLFTLCR